MNSGASESGESTSNSSQGSEANIIDAILGQMKSEFNKTEKAASDVKEEAAEDAPTDSSLSNTPQVKTEESTNDDTSEPGPGLEEANKPRIILSFKKPSPETALGTGRRSLRHKTNPEEKIDEAVLKRSARRRSKDCNESVLQSAIARKEKSYNEASKPQRLTRQLKPTQKILENLALAKQEKSKTEKPKPRLNDKQKSNDSDSFPETEDDRIHRKHKHKHHHNRHNKKAKRLKNCHGESSKESDSDQSEEAVSRIMQKPERSRRRVSNSRVKDEENTDGDEPGATEAGVEEVKTVDGSGAEAEVASRLCLCTQKTQYYLATNEEETTYCAAVDNIGDKFVGCSRIIETKEIMLMRSSTRVPYTILCEAHRNRLLRHNCCPTCGVFCTQGRFVECESKHHYHRECQINVSETESCPHCGASSPSSDVDITMHSSKRPIFLPVQKSQ